MARKVTRQLVKRKDMHMSVYTYTHICTCLGLYDIYIRIYVYVKPKLDTGPDREIKCSEK